MEFSTVLPPASREGALQFALDFAPKMGCDYAKNRNFVRRGHPDVSRLAPAIRVRLLRESELADVALEKHGTLARCEKWVQEIHWRSYWRSWLELRPEIWTRYQNDRDAFENSLPKAQKRRIEQVENGASGVEIMDKFARELVETGFLHNHARMWFAAFWIHTERLPWQLGADFFERHLLCACPASNTLSWRWVAGIQTAGKAYLARRSNLEKYCDDWYLDDTTGLERLEKPSAALIEIDAFPAPVSPDFATKIAPSPLKTGLWICEDDLAPETSVLRAAAIAAACVSVVGAPEKSEKSNGKRRQFRREAAHDCAARAEKNWSCEATVFAEQRSDLAAKIEAWARENQLRRVVMLRPFVGETSDVLPEVGRILEKNGVELTLLRRQEDAQVLRHATSGYFKFWQGIKNP